MTRVLVGLALLMGAGCGTETKDGDDPSPNTSTADMSHATDVGSDDAVEAPADMPAEDAELALPAVGDPCTFDDQASTCPDGGFCRTDPPQGYCSITCDADTACPDGSRCAAGTCWRQCSADAPCRDGYGCTTVTPDEGPNVQVCIEN